MGCRLVLFFLMLAVVDLWLLYRIAITYGFLWAVAVAFGPSLLGGDIARRQRGLAFNDMQAALQRGEPPSQKLVEGLMLLFVGVLLIMPGPISSVLGLLMLVPFFRGVMARLLIGAARRHVEGGMQGREGQAPGDEGGVGPGGVYVRVVQVGDDKDAGPDDPGGAPYPRPRPRPVMGPDGLKTVEGHTVDGEADDDTAPPDRQLPAGDDADDRPADGSRP